MAQRNPLSGMRATSKRVSKILDEEQRESVLGVASVFEAITSDETIAHLQSRVDFLERQVGMLDGRRDAHDEGWQSALDVMRARIEDALPDVSGGEADALARRVEGELQSLRSEIEIKLDELTNRVSAADARWTAERASLSARLEALEAPEK